MPPTRVANAFVVHCRSSCGTRFKPGISKNETELLYLNCVNKMHKEWTKAHRDVAVEDASTATVVSYAKALTRFKQSAAARGNATLASLRGLFVLDEAVYRRAARREARDMLRDGCARREGGPGSSQYWHSIVPEDSATNHRALAGGSHTIYSACTHYTALGLLRRR